jgi:hypothetical protein
MALVLLSASGLADAAAVRTNTGLVQGVLDDNVMVYKGLPFEAGTMPDLSAHFLMDTYMNATRAL